MAQEEMKNYHGDEGLYGMFIATMLNGTFILIGTFLLQIKKTSSSNHLFS